MIGGKQELQEIKEKLQSSNAYIQDCFARISNNQYVDITGFDDGVRDLCDRILALKGEEGKSLQKDLENLLASLEKLEKNIEEKTRD